MRKKEKLPNQGFTLVELLIVVSIISILSAIGLTSYLSFSRNQIVIQTARKIAQDLRLAQSLASNNQKPEDCGSSTLLSYTFSVNQGQRKYSIYADCGSQIQVKTDSVPSVLTLTGATIVKFKVLRQGVETTGGTTITVTGFGKSRVVQINGGAITVQGE